MVRIQELGYCYPRASAKICGFAIDNDQYIYNRKRDTLDFELKINIIHSVLFTDNLGGYL
jgi:hypothetical protein